MSLNKNLNHAIIKSMTGKYAVYVIQLCSLAFLARLFSPEQFGVVAAAQVFVVFFQMLATSGLAPAVVYQQNITNDDRDGIFSFSLIFGLILCAFFALLVQPLFDWYGFSSGIEIFYVLLGCILFSSLSMLPMASLQKDTRFHAIASAEVFAELISLGVCLYLYYLGYTYIAIAAKLLVIAVGRFIFYYSFSAKTSIGLAKLGKNISAVKQLYGFAKYQLAFNFLNYFSRNLDNILIGKIFGAAVLGGYEKVYQVMRYPLQLFTFAITPALQPVLTKHKDQPSVVATAYYQVAFKLALVGLFASTVLFWNSSAVIFILFGEQWTMSAPMLSLLAVSIPLQMVLSSTGGVFQAFGKAREQFLCGVFSSFTNVTAICVGIYFKDVLLICALLPISFMINYFQCFYLLHKRCIGNFKLIPFLIITFVVISAYCNLFFFNLDFFKVPTNYTNAILSSSIFSFVTLFPVTLIFLMFKKLINKSA